MLRSISCSSFLLGFLSLLVSCGNEVKQEQAVLDRPETVKTIAEITIKDLKFVPEVITVTPGTRVVWKNLDAVDHDVTSGKSINGRKARGLKQTKFPDGRFASDLFGRSKTFSVVLNDRGDFPYFCNVHPFMTGEIIVKSR